MPSSKSDAQSADVVSQSEQANSETTMNATNDASDDAQITDRTILPRAELEQTGETGHGPTYRCPRCGFGSVSEYCDCPECGWAGMCQEGFQ